MLLLLFQYNYVNIDDCWADYRDKQNRTVPDKKLFPSGMYALGEYIHSLSLKFGIYSDAGSETCVGKPGGLGYEVIDALTYAAWGVDYLKVTSSRHTRRQRRVSHTAQVADSSQTHPFSLSLSLHSLLF